MISNAEWEVMRVLWASGPKTSNDIIEILFDKLGWSDSTVKTLLRRLIEKNAISRVKQSRAYLYKAETSEKGAYLNELNEVLGKICVTDHSLLLQEVLKSLPMTTSDISSFEAILLFKKSEVVDVVSCNCVVGQCRCHNKEEVSHVH